MGFWPIRVRARSYLYYKIKYVYCIWLVCFSKLDFFERCGKWRLAGIDPCINIIHPANEFILLSIKNKLCIWIFFIEWLQSLLYSDKNKENSLSIATKRFLERQSNTWLLADMEFLFSCWTRYLTNSLPSLMRCRVEHEKENSISPSNHELFCILYKRLTNKKKSTLFTFHVSRTRCHSFMMLNRASVKHVKIFRNLSRVETRFLSVVIL